jgi:hypothetical protein
MPFDVLPEQPMAKLSNVCLVGVGWATVEAEREATVAVWR